MRSFRRIVVGLDLDPEGQLSEGSRRALAQAHWIADRTGAQVTWIHSTADDEHWENREEAYVPFQRPCDPQDTLREAIAGIAGETLQGELVVTDEKAWLAITRHVLRTGSDLVVVGRRSQRRREGPLLGSVSNKLLRKCPGAVWVVKPDSELHPRRVLAASDLSAVGERVLELAVSLARALPAALHVAHTFQLSMSIQLEGGAAQERFAEETRAVALQRIRSLLGDGEPGASAELHVALSSPTRVILECVQRHHVDLVVMGSISRGGVPGLLLGNTAERLLGRLDCSLLVVKPEDFRCPVEARSD